MWTRCYVELEWALTVEQLMYNIAVFSTATEKIRLLMRSEWFCGLLTGLQNWSLNFIETLDIVCRQCLLVTKFKLIVFVSLVWSQDQTCLIIKWYIFFVLYVLRRYQNDYANFSPRVFCYIWTTVELETLLPDASWRQLDRFVTFQYCCHSAVIFAIRPSCILAV